MSKDLKKDMKELQKLLMALEAYGDFGGLAQPIPSDTDEDKKISLNTGNILSIVQKALSSFSNITNNLMEKVDRVAVTFNEIDEKIKNLEGTKEEFKKTSEKIVSLERKNKVLESEVKIKLEEITGQISEINEKMKRQEEDVSDVMDKIITTIENLSNRVKKITTESLTKEVIEEYDKEIEGLKDKIYDLQGQVEATKALQLQSFEHLKTIVSALEGEGFEDEEEEENETEENNDEEEEENETETEEKENIENEEENNDEEENETETEEKENIENEEENNKESKEQNSIPTGGNSAENFGDEIDFNKIIKETERVINKMQEKIE